MQTHKSDKTLHMAITDHGGTLTAYQKVWPTIDSAAYVFHGAQVIGDVVIGAGTSIWHNAVIRGDVCHIRIGSNSNVQDGSVIHVSSNKYPTLIGDHVLIAHMVMLHGCTLHDYAFVGMGAIVLDNTVIEENGMLAAGGMLTPGKTIAANELWGGRPAKFMRMLRDDEIAKNRSMALHYRKIAEQHAYDGRGEVNPSPYPVLTLRK